MKTKHRRFDRSRLSNAGAESIAVLPGFDCAGVIWTWGGANSSGTHRDEQLLAIMGKCDIAGGVRRRSRNCGTTI